VISFSDYQLEEKSGVLNLIKLCVLNYMLKRRLIEDVNIKRGGALDRSFVFQS